MDGVDVDAVRYRLTAAGVRLTADGDTLRVLAPPGALTPELRQAITDHKSALLAALTGFCPLDEMIVASEAGRHSLPEIEARLAQLTALAIQPDATPLDKQLAHDWTAIRDAKLAGRHVA